MAKSKYNNKKVVIDGFTFDSIVEGKYYEQVKWLKATGEILSFTLQPRYILQEAFRKDGVSYRKVEFVADFEIQHIDKTIEVIDIKGWATETAKLKFKLFQNKYKHKLSLIAYSKIDGGWISMSQLAKNRKIRKKQKESD